MIDFKGMEKTAAVSYAIKYKNGPSAMWLCVDDGDIGNFSNEIILAKVNSADLDFFQNDYVRFLARVEGLALGFVKPGAIGWNSAIDFDLILKVCEVVQNMPGLQRQAMAENLRTYRVLAF